jgi:hypothetical protein
MSGTLTFNPGWSFWISETTYWAAYDVADSDVTVPNISVTVTGAHDANGTVQDP